jgi:elongation factor Ts
MTITKEEIQERLQKTRPTKVFSYIHGEGRIGVLLEIESDTDFALRNDLVIDFAKEVMLQIASMNPMSVDETDLPDGLLLDLQSQWHEKLIQQGKPEPVIGTIVLGKIGKYIQENCLLCQPWVKDNTKLINELLNDLREALGEDLEIINFSRFGN